MKRLSYLFLLVVLAGAGCNRGEVIESLGNYDITKEEFGEHYAASVELAARLANAEKPTLYKLVCNPELAPNAQAYDMATRLQPEAKYNEFREAKRIELVAEEEGFTDRPLIKRIIEESRTATIAQLYLMEKMWEKIKISEEDKTRTCQELRQQDPRRMGPYSAEDCLRIAEGVLKDRAMKENYRKVREEIVEQVKVTKNIKDDELKNYLENELPLYQTIKTEGGCKDVKSNPASDASTPVLPGGPLTPAPQP